MSKEEKKVIVYSTSTCPWCDKVKDFLKENRVHFTEFNVGEDREKAKEMIEKSGQMGVPVIDVEGEIVIGFDINRLRKLLDL